jgi:hypothetical protein
MPQHRVVPALGQRCLETVTHRLANLPVDLLYADLAVGSKDTFLMKLIETSPATERARTRIHGVPPESIGIRRLSHPEEFGIIKEFGIVK